MALWIPAMSAMSSSVSADAERARRNPAILAAISQSATPRPPFGSDHETWKKESLILSARLDTLDSLKVMEPHEESPLMRSPGRSGRAFTLIEVLIVVGIIGVLIALALPAIGRGIERARSFKCQMSLRSVAFDFAIFADSDLHGERGDDRDRYGPYRFSLETFQESQYGVDEFWSFGSTDTVTRSTSASEDAMRCSEVRAPITYRRNTPCRNGAVGPAGSISFGFNSRLYKKETVDARSRPRISEVQLTSAILAQPNVPLAWDVDGAKAGRDVLPIFSAPSLDSQGPYAGDRFWFPGARHAGQLNVALIDGSVHSTAQPLSVTGWDWGYQPPGL